MTKIDALIHELGHHDGFVAQRARKKLEQMGAEAIPALADALRVGSQRARWEAALALQNMYAPEAVDALVDALDDPNQGVRWLASQALIKLGSSAYQPLLEALLIHPERDRLRKSAGRVLKGIYMLPEARTDIHAILDQIENYTTPHKLRLVVADALAAAPA